MLSRRQSIAATFWDFASSGTFSILPVHAIVARDCVEIHFGKTDTGTAASPNIRWCAQNLDAYIWMSDLDPFTRSCGHAAQKLWNLRRHASISAMNWSSRMIWGIAPGFCDGSQLSAGRFRTIFKAICERIFSIPSCAKMGVPRMPHGANTQ